MKTYKVIKLILTISIDLISFLFSKNVKPKTKDSIGYVDKKELIIKSLKMVNLVI